MTGPTIDPISRRALQYQHAFDWLAVQLQAAGDSAAYSGTISWHAGELLRRTSRVAFLEPVAPGLKAMAASLGVAEPAIHAPDEKLWATIGLPITNAAQLELVNHLQPGGRFHIVSAGRLAPFTVDQKKARSDTLLSEHDVHAALKFSPVRIMERSGIFGLAALGRFLQAPAALKLRRRDLHDRYQFAMRREFVCSGMLAGFSVLVCLTLEKAV